MSFLGVPPKASPETCRQVEAKINYKFENQFLLVEALYAGGLAYIGGRVIHEANNQLALVGRAAMGLAIVDRAYAAEKLTGKMKEHFNSVNSEESLNAKGRAKGISEYLAHAGDAKSVTNKMIVIAVRAILGAVFRDSRNIDRVREVMFALGLFDALSPLER